MKDNPKISIIVPIYNSEKYLSRCIDSILSQTYKNIEIILVEDGSPDNCGLICDDYSRKDSRVKVIHQKNKGVSAARNIGLDYATGDYIGFVDSDDYIELDMYDTLWRLIKETEADIACISMIIHDENGRPLVVDEKQAVWIYTSEEAIRNMFFDNTTTCGHLWNKLYKAELFHNLRLDEMMKAREDALIMWELFNRSNRIVYQRIGKYHYMYYPSSAIHSYTPAFLTGRKASLHLLERTKENFPKIYAYAQFYLIEADFQIIARMVMADCFEKKYYDELSKEIKNNLTKEVKQIYKNQKGKNKLSLFLMLYNVRLYMIIKKIRSH